MQENYLQQLYDGVLSGETLDPDPDIKILCTATNVKVNFGVGRDIAITRIGHT